MICWLSATPVVSPAAGMTVAAPPRRGAECRPVLVDVDAIVAGTIDGKRGVRRIDLDRLAARQRLQVEGGMPPGDPELRVVGIERREVDLRAAAGADERLAARSGSRSWRRRRRKGSRRRPAPCSPAPALQSSAPGRQKDTAPSMKRSRGGVGPLRESFCAYTGRGPGPSPASANRNARTIGWMRLEIIVGNLRVPPQRAAPTRSNPGWP